MNRLEETARWLEAGAPERNFNMNRLLNLQGNAENNWCGTECCIAGYVVSRWGNPNLCIESQACKLLGISSNVADALFYPRELNNPEEQINSTAWENITPAQAAQAVRNVMEHDDPHWREILE